MITTTKTVRAELELEPEEIAAYFCEMSSLDQAHFFNEVAAMVKTWEGTFDVQMDNVTTEGVLNDDGRRIMKTIGDYSTKQWTSEYSNLKGQKKCSKK